MNKKPFLLALIAVGLLGIAVGIFSVVLCRPTTIGGSANLVMLRDTLRANPEIILEALQILQDRRGGATRIEQRTAIVAQRAALLEDADSFVGSNPQGDVTVVEFFDYRCPIAANPWPRPAP